MEKMTEKQARKVLSITKYGDHSLTLFDINKAMDMLKEEGVLEESSLDKAEKIAEIYIHNYDKGFIESNNIIEMIDHFRNAVQEAEDDR